ncbi:MAG: PIG-L family deacetylase [Thermoplasmata archaeon]|nr:MAG: PIG-L family deacetylase [Thermoplasmata archaeon]
MNFEEDHRVIALGAHPDDIELGCGGFLSKLKSKKAETWYVAMSKCNNQFSEDEKDTLVKEQACAAEVLGLQNCTIHDFPNKELPEYRREIMDIFNELQGKLNPTIVLIPHIKDPHQDHSTVGYCAIRTFRSGETILQYEILRHGSATFTPNLYINITDFIDTKIKAIQCYASQKVKRKFFDEDSYRALARTRGTQCGYEYAEGFEIYRMYW